MPYTAMGNNKISTATKLTLITKRSIHNPQEKFTSLKHLLDEEYLKECFKELKGKKASGVDGKTKEEYSEVEIDNAIKEVITKMKAKKYHPKPVRRVFIKKANGKQRPLGIPTIMDKTVQLAIKKILEAIYEPHFLENSYGFRPKRNCHQALKAVHTMVATKPINWIIDVDIKGFFDNVDHHWMIECLNERISDPNFRSLIIKFLKAGVIEVGKYEKTNKGTPQGGILSPLLANIYLHYVLDMWFEKVEKKRINGYTEIIRYADDFIIGAQTKVEAYQILKDLKERLKKFKLEVSVEKTGIKEFGKYAQQNSKNRGKRKADTFDFLGFTHYCSKSRKGNFLMKVKTNKSRQSRALKEMNDWLKKIRNQMKAKQIWIRLASKMRGHFNYYGISSNSRSINSFNHQTRKLVFKWMNRRSQKQSFNWEEFDRYTKLYPLPKPSLVFNMYDIW